MADTLVVAELLEGKSRKTTLSAITLARQIAQSTGGAFDIFVLGENAKAAASELAGFGARKLLVTEIPGGYVCEKYAPTVVEAAKKGGYGVIASTASTYGKDLLPRVAARLDAGYAADVSRSTFRDREVLYRRPMYAGNVFGDVQVTSPIQVVTVRQSEFEPAAASGGASPIEEVPHVGDALAQRVEFVGLETVKSERPELAEATVVVAGGRALKNKENFEKLLEPLADVLGAAMGASRAACDAGFCSNELQVGQTGKVVAPKLYLAIGISGAIQHLAGMKSSKVIVAINKDKEAPIAQIADYFMVDDLFKVVPALTEEIRKAKAEQ